MSRARTTTITSPETGGERHHPRGKGIVARVSRGGVVIVPFSYCTSSIRDDRYQVGTRGWVLVASFYIVRGKSRETSFYPILGILIG